MHDIRHDIDLEPITRARNRRVIARALLASLAIVCAAPVEAAVTFTRIAHSDDALFASLKLNQPAFTQFHFAAPSINALGEVAFLAGAIDNSSADVGLYRGNGGAAAQELARGDGNLDEPGNPLNFIAASAVPLAFDGDVVFGATLKSGGTGIFRHDAASGTNAAIATDRFVAPGSGFATGLYDSIALRPAMNGNGEVVFAAVHDGGATAGLFRGADPLADRLIDTTQTTRLASFWNDPAIASGGLVGAVSNNFDGAGPTFFNEIALLPATVSAGETVLDSTLAGTPALIQSPTLDIDHNSRAVYVGRSGPLAAGTPDTQILLASAAAPTHSLADAKFSGAGYPFRSFESEVALSDSNTVAFVARNLAGERQLIAHQIGRTTASQGNAYAEVLRSGQMLDGHVVQNIHFTREGLNDRGEFAFIADLDDGTSAVYKANFGSSLPGAVPQPGLRSEAEVRHYDLRTHAEVVDTDVELAPVPGQAVADAVNGTLGHAHADSLNDATGSHLKTFAEAKSVLDFVGLGGTNTESEARALSSVITNWTLPNPHPGNGKVGETVQMLVTIDGSLHYERQPGPVLVGLTGQGRLSAPGSVAYTVSGPVQPPNLPLVAEVNYIVNANVGGSTFNAFGGYASLRNGSLHLGGDWDPSDWAQTATSDSLTATIDTFVTVEYDVRYDEIFALEFVVESFAGAHFFGTGSAVSDFGNTARFSLRTLSGAPLVQLDSVGAALVPLPPSLVLLLPACAVLLRRSRGAK